VLCRDGIPAAVRDGMPARLAALSERLEALPRQADPAVASAVRLLVDSLRSMFPDTVDDQVETLRRLAAEAERDGSLLARTDILLRLARALRWRAGGGQGAPGAQAGTGGRAGGEDRAGFADRAEARRLGLEVLADGVRRGMLRESAADGLLTARASGRTALEVAHWAVEDGVPEDALAALESGRALVLHTHYAHRPAADRLRALGRPDLAEAWSGRAPGGGHTGSEPFARADPGAGMTLPSTLRRQVLTALEQDPETAGLLRTPPPARIADALGAAGAQALVHLVPPAPDGDGPGGALVTGADGQVWWHPLPGTSRREAAVLTEYLEALHARTTATGDDRAPADARWRAALERVRQWAGREVLGPLVPRLRTVHGAGPGGIPRLVPVPLGDFGAVPWSAVPTPGRSAGGLAVDELALSVVPSARLFVAAAHRPAVRRTTRALLVCGLTRGAAWAATGPLHRDVYVHAELLTGDPADTARDGVRPLTVASLLRALEGAPRHTVVDITAHLAPDPVEPWRSAVALPDGDLRADRIAGLDLGAAGTGVCVSLASCVSNISARHPDENFTVAAAFLTAGASCVLGSLWPVSVGVTGLLMVLFHHHLARGHTPVEALRRAQLWMRDPGRTAPRRFGDAAAREELDRRTRRLEAGLADRGSSPVDPVNWAGIVLLGR